VLIDLHTHSTASDGTLTPSEVITAAARAGVDVVALTDHDSAQGWDEAGRAARAAGIVLVPGTEISCRSHGISVHLLSYLHDPTHPGLAEQFAMTRDDRIWRARRMVDLIAVDYPLTWDDVVAQVPAGATLGRPHIADALVARGHVATRDDAFATILVTGSPYYVGHYAPEVTDAIRLVRAAGGVPVVAHPRAGRRGRLRAPGDTTATAEPMVTDGDLAAFAAAGLAGLEVDHRDHSPDDRDQLRALADRLGLLATGSSDFHGTGKSNRLGENGTDPQVLEAIEAQASGTSVIRR
jgi:3',5'-nucleoside bisphosphate phosphatase